MRKKIKIVTSLRKRVDKNKKNISKGWSVIELVYIDGELGCNKSKNYSNPSNPLKTIEKALNNINYK